MNSNYNLVSIYRRTDGFCHLCHKKLALKHYARVGERGAWEIEHSVPRAWGGTDHGNNLYAACIRCNRSKGKRSTRAARRRNGQTRASYGREKKAGMRLGNSATGAGLGAGVGLLFGPGGWLVGGLLGALAGHEKKVC